MPVVTVPFEWIGIDIVGPLTPLGSHHKYIFAVVDYATPYPEVVPLHNIRADTVIKELALPFSQVGFPKQVV